MLAIPKQTPTASVQALARDAAVGAHRISIAYLSLEQASPRPRDARKKITDVGLSLDQVVNVSMIDSNYAELLIHNSGEWLKTAENLLKDHLILDFSKIDQPKEHLVLRLNNQIKTSKDKRARDFYGTWLEGLKN